jgi:hypothetical protein
MYYLNKLVKKRKNILEIQNLLTNESKILLSETLIKNLHYALKTWNNDALNLISNVIEDLDLEILIDLQIFHPYLETNPTQITQLIYLKFFEIIIRQRIEAIYLKYNIASLNNIEEVRNILFIF